MTANTPPKPHTEGMEWTNAETGIKYMFTNGGWRAVSSEASEDVADAIDGLDLQTVLDNGNVADKGAEFGGKVKVQPGTEDNEVVTFGQLAEETANAVDNAAFVNQDNTFASNKTNTFNGDLKSNKQLTIAAPSDTNFNPTFQIRGTARTGTKDSIVLRATNSNDRMRITYRGPIDNDDELTNKKYVDDTVADVATPDLTQYVTKAEFERWVHAPARLAWKWSDVSTGDADPGAGYFTYTTNGGDHYYRFSFQTANRVRLDQSIINSFNRNIDNGPVGTIWYKAANTDSNWKFKQEFRINTFRWNYNNHFEMRVSSRTGQTSFTTDLTYYITVGGFF